MSLAAVILVSLVTTTVGQSSSAAAADAAQQAQTQTPKETPTPQSAPAAPAAPANQANQANQPKQTNQSETQAGEKLPVSLDRIRKALDEIPSPASDAPRPRLKVDTNTVPVFRTQTQGTTVKLTPVFDDGTDVGAYVRPPLGLYDYEFKQMVTPDAVKGCGRLTQSECLQSFANQFATGLLWNYATQKKKPAASSAPAAPDAETQRIRAQIQQELLDQQSATSATTPPSKP